MPDISRIKLNYRPKPYGYKLRVPAQYHGEFLRLLNLFVPYYKDLIATIIKEVGGGVVKFPMDTDLMVKYLEGYTIHYIAFYDDEGEKPKDGHFEIIDKQAGIFAVYYNTYYPPKRQRATRIHETWHIFQLMDGEFRDFIKHLIYNTELPPDVIVLLLERAAEKATFMYLLPNDYLKEKFKETQDIKTLSDYFQASIESLYYSIQECGLNYVQ